MKHMLTIIICVLIFVLHVYLGWQYCDWTWITRSGASIVAVGILLESWKLLMTSHADDMPIWRSQEGHAAIRAAILIVCVGTLIQGYGDLLFRYFACT